MRPGHEPAADRSPRASGRHRRAIVAPRGVLLVASLSALALVGALIGPLPSNATRFALKDPTRAAITGAETTRGCKPPPEPTPTPTVTPTPPPSPSPDPSASPTPSPIPTPPPTPRPTPTPYLPPGVDVSVWNWPIDFAPVRAAGMRFVFIRATQGTTLVDKHFVAHVAHARAEGLLIGAYHFFDYRADGLAQADHFVETAAAAGMLVDALPLAIDVECLDSFGWAEHAVAVPALRALVDQVYARTGRKPILYTSRHMWSQVTGGDRTFGDLPLWVACWGCTKPPMPTGWSGWRFWQTGLFRFPALGRKLDGDVFKGTDASLERWRGLPVVIDEGARVTGDPQVALDIAGLDGTEVRTADDLADWTPWRARTAPVEHTLTAGDGDREVRVQVRRADGLEGPVLADRILLDTTPPVLGPPILSIRAATVGADGSVPVTVAWTAADALAGVATSTLVHTCGPGLQGEAPADLNARTASRTPTTAGRADARRRVLVAGEGTAAVDGSVAPGDCRMTVRGVDRVGNRAEPGDPVTVTVTLVDDLALVLRHGLAWTDRTRAGAIAGTVLRTTTAGATVRITVQGTQVGIVASRGPSGGRVLMLLDGIPSTIADLYAPVVGLRMVVATVALPDPAPHRLKLIVLRRPDPASRGTRVDLDGLVVTETPAGSPAPSPDPEAAAVAD